MRLDDCYSIRKQGDNIILQFECHTGEMNKKTGKEVVTKKSWYYPNIKACLLNYLYKYVETDIGYSTADGVLERIKKVENIILNSK